MTQICIVCGDIVSEADFALMSEEFKAYPAHSDCFDSFSSADAFLAFATSRALPTEEIIEAPPSRPLEITE